MKIPKFSNPRALFKTVKYVYKQNPVACLTSDISFVVLTGLEIYAIKLSGKFIDATADILMNWETFDISEYILTDSFQFMASLLIIWILTSGLNQLRYYSQSSIERSVNLKANYDIMQKISSENLQEVEQMEFQKLVAFVPSYSVERIVSTYLSFSEVIRNIITAVSALTILYSTMGYSIVFLMIIAIPEPIMDYFADTRLRNYRKKEIEGIKYVNKLREVAMSIPAFAELKVNGIYKFFKREFWINDGEYQEGILAHIRSLHTQKAMTSGVGQIFFYFYVVYILVIAIQQRLSIGQFKALYDYAQKVYSSSYNILKQSSIMLNDLSYATEFFTFLEYEGFGDLDSGTAKLKKGTPELQLLNLDFEYPDDRHKVLEDVNFTIKAGEKVAFVGGDGSGKSSLIKTLCGLYEIKAGDYMIDGYSIRELGRGELKKKLSVVFQNFMRYDFTVKKNITISSERVNFDSALYKKVKEVSGVNEFMKREKIGDNQILGKYFTGGKEISPGYWQRLAIARMLYRDRNIFIMDEPFTFVDGPSRQKIIQNIIDFLGENKTLIYITQDTDNLDKFDRIYYIYQGKVLEEGTYRELMKKKGSFYKEAKANS